MASHSVTRNRTSVANSRTSADLAEGSEFVGTYEPCGGFNTLVFTVLASSTHKIGSLAVEFSEDKSAVSAANRMRVMDEQLGQAIGCPVRGSYFRVRFFACAVEDTRATPSANTFTALQILTKLLAADLLGECAYNLANIPVSVRGVETFAGVSFSGSVQRIVSDHADNTTVATMPLPASGCAVKVTNDGAANHPGGTGACTFLVIGVTASPFNEYFWKGDFVGNGNSTASSAKFVFVNDFRILTFGSGEKPAGTYIRVQMHVSSTDYTVASLDSANGFKYSTCAFMVPAGVSATTKNMLASSDVTSNTSSFFSLVKHGTVFPRTLVTSTGNKPLLLTALPCTAKSGDVFVGEVVADAALTLEMRALVLLQSGAPDTSNFVFPPLPFTPTPSDFALWWDANVVESFDGTTWTDQSGNGRDGTVSSAGVFTQTTNGSRNSVSVNNTNSADQSFTGPGVAFLNGTDLYFSCVFTNYSDDTSTVLPVLNASGTGYSYSAGVAAGISIHFDNNIQSAVTVPFVGTMMLSMLLQAGQPALVFLNGTQVISDNTFTHISNFPSSTYLGVQQQSGTLRRLDFHDFFILLRAPNTTERQRLEGYEAWKWGFQGDLPGGHPYASAPP